MTARLYNIGTARALGHALACLHGYGVAVRSQPFDPRSNDAVRFKEGAMDATMSNTCGVLIEPEPSPDSPRAA